MGGHLGGDEPACARQCAHVPRAAVLNRESDLALGGERACPAEFTAVLGRGPQFASAQPRRRTANVQYRIEACKEGTHPPMRV
jgi:hypothetical protein